MAPDPFGAGPSDRKSENPRGPRQSQMSARQSGGKQGDACVECEQRWQPGSRNRHQPPESGDIDEKRARNPIKPRHEKTEAEDIAETEGRARTGTAFIKPQQPGEGHEE